MAIVLDTISEKALSRKLWNNFRSCAFCTPQRPTRVKPLCMALHGQLNARPISGFCLCILQFESGARPRTSLALLHQSGVIPKLAAM